MLNNWLNNFLDSRLKSIGYVKANEINRVDPGIIFRSEMSYGSEYQLYSNWSEWEFQRLALTNPWVFSNIDMLSNIVAEGVLKVQQRSDNNTEKWNDVINHDFEKIVEGRPNPYMGQFYAQKYQAMWYLLRGEAFWMLVPDKRTKELTSMYPLPANRVLPIPSPTDMFSGFAYTPVSGQKPQIIEPQYICYHRFPNLTQYHSGYSKLSSYLKELKIDTAASTFDLQDYENGLALKQLISLSPEMDETKFLQFLADLQQAQEEGLRYMTVRGGDMDVKAIASRRNEQRQSSIREEQGRLGGRVWGVPEGIWQNASNRASVEAHKQILVEFGAWPVMVMFSEDMTAQIIMRYYEDNLRVVYEDIRPEDKDQKREDEKHNRSIQTYNEAREVKGLDPHENELVGNAPYQVAPKIYELVVIDELNTQMLISPETKSVNYSERQVDLKNWKSIALRMFKREENPADYDFQSEYLAPNEMSRIKSLLLDVRSSDQIKSVFKQAQAFIPTGIDDLSDIPDEDKIIEEIENESLVYSQDFDSRVPEAVTLLEVE